MRPRNQFLILELTTTDAFCSQYHHAGSWMLCKTINDFSFLALTTFGAEYPLRLSVIFWQKLTTVQCSLSAIAGLLVYNL